MSGESDQAEAVEPAQAETAGSAEPGQKVETVAEVEQVPEAPREVPWQPDALGAMNVGEALLEQEPPSPLSEATRQALEGLRMKLWLRGYTLEEALEALARRGERHG